MVMKVEARTNTTGLSKGRRKSVNATDLQTVMSAFEVTPARLTRMVNSPFYHNHGSSMQRTIRKWRDPNRPEKMPQGAFRDLLNWLWNSPYGEHQEAKAKIKSLLGDDAYNRHWYREITVTDGEIDRIATD
jgi:hypothetical protein